MPFRLFALLITTALAVGLAGCDKGDGHDHDHAHDHDHDHDGHGHHHEAPHGGTLIALGDHVAHLELALDSNTGTLTLWVLDGEAEHPLRIEAESLTLSDFRAAGVPSTEVLEGQVFTLKAVANELTGETVGDTSTFVVTDDRLKSWGTFTATMDGSAIPGVGDKAIEIKYPEGNEQ